MGYTSGAMPWKTITPMEEITRFVLLAQTDRFTITDLCEQFGISRNTGHRYLERYAAGGCRACSHAVIGRTISRSARMRRWRG